MRVKRSTNTERDMAASAARSTTRQGACGRSWIRAPPFGKLAEAPTALEGYLTLSGIFERSSLPPKEQQVLLLAAAQENDCEFCIAAHTAGARKAGVPADAIEVLRRGGELEAVAVK